MRSAVHAHDWSSLVGKLHSGPSWRWQLWEPSTTSVGLKKDTYKVTLIKMREQYSKYKYSKKTTNILLDEVFEGEVFTGQQEYPLKILLVDFALLPKCWLKQVWCDTSNKVKYTVCIEIHVELCWHNIKHNIDNNLSSMSGESFLQ